MGTVQGVGASPDGLSQVLQRVQQIQLSVASLAQRRTAPSDTFVGALEAASPARVEGTRAETRTAGSTTSQWAQAASLLAPTLLTRTPAVSPAAAGGNVAPPASAGGTGASSRPAVLPVTSPTALLGPGGVPVDLQSFGNGRIPGRALVDIDRGTHRLWSPAAVAFRALEAAAARDGVRFGVTDSYRSYEAQVEVAARKGLYSEGGLAARPGTSDHGWGRSLDLDLSPQAQRWMRAHAAAYGFQEDVPREPWHWTYTPPS